MAERTYTLKLTKRELQLIFGYLIWLDPEQGYHKSHGLRSVIRKIKDVGSEDARR